MYRKFWLINSLGEKYDFTSKDSAGFLHLPEGLGFSRSFSSIKIGNSELVTSHQFNLTDIKGELLFAIGTNGDIYEAYYRFIQFAKYKPLEFHYQTPNNLMSYHCDVLFVQADKSEIAFEDHMMHIPIVFHRLTEWLDDNDETYVMSNDLLDAGKYHDLIYDYHYAGTNLSNTILNNNGTDDIGFILEVFGDVENMQFSLTQAGETYGICKINGTYDYVRIDSIERTESIYLELDGSAITNPEQYQDFTIRNGASYLTWCKLRVGQSQFAFTCGNIDTFDGIVRVRFKNSYASV